MADAALEVRSPLAGFALPSGPRFRLSEAPPAARFILRGGEAVGVACGMVFGAEPPSTLGPAGEGRRARGALAWPGRMAADRGRRRLAPISDVLESVLDGTAHSLVDVSHRQIGLIASGPAAARVLNAGCPLDLGLTAFPVGFATRTLFDKVEIVLWRRAEASLHIEIWRSFAPYLAGSLAEAARGAPQW